MLQSLKVQWSFAKNLKYSNDASYRVRIKKKFSVHSDFIYTK